MTGQTVVYADFVSVITVTCPVGQFVTEAGHDVTVTTFVVYTVDNTDVTISLLTLYVLGIVFDE